jgi:hypothetical protein
MRRQPVCVAILVLLFAAQSSAQGDLAAGGKGVPPVVRFSGTLAVPPGRVAVTFALYTDQTGGEPLWVETQPVSVDAGGRYAVVLGTTTALSSELFASGEARWLDVTVDGLAPRPRALLVSVPYALKAADADTVGGRPLSAFVLAGDRTGVGADGLTYVDTRVLSAGLSGNGAPGGAGSPGYVGVFTDATTLGNSTIFQWGSNIGVGTTTPAAAFHSVGTAAPGAYFDVYSSALGALPVVYRAARGTPQAPSAVQADDILGGLAVRGYGATAFSAGRGQVMFKAAENWTDEANGTYLQFTTTPLGSGTWVERIRVTPAGNVGIGTSAPAQKLSVAGTVESTAGGFRFPDGTTQATAGAAYTAGAGLSLASNAFSVTFGGTGAATTAARSDHHHDAAYVALGGTYNNPSWLTGLAATKLAGNLPVAQVTGAATLGANTFTATQTISSGNLALPVTTASMSGVLTLGGQPFLHAYGGTTYPNTFVGVEAGSFSGSGDGGNVGVGYQALAANTTGSWNTASGLWALRASTTGSWNIANGEAALYANTTGSANVAIGASALQSNTTGSSNVAIGQLAGFNLTTGNYNLDIGHSGVAAEGNTIRIGMPGNHTRTFVAGIRGVTTGTANAIPVLIDSNGQLGTISSSRRVKDDIADMAGTSSGLMKLRPVTFHYKTDQNPAGRTLQYGLIAEEVAAVYPGLVAHAADGQIETVMYQFLPPMLLNEYQKQQRTIDELRAQVAAADAQTRRLTEQVEALTQAVAALRDRKQ